MNGRIRLLVAFDVATRHCTSRGLPKLITRDPPVDHPTNPHGGKKIAVQRQVALTRFVEDEMTEGLTHHHNNTAPSIARKSPA